MAHQSCRDMQTRRRCFRATRYFALACVLSATGGGCRGKTSSKAPILIVRDMHTQIHLRPLAELPGAPRGASARPLPPGVVARESTVLLGAMELGKANGEYLARVPVKVDEALLEQGRERFDIYCSVCHDRAGSGQGTNPQRGFPGPIDLASDNTRSLRDGQIFEIITQGIRNMPELGDQVPITDRWAIVAYVRALQRSQHAHVDDVEPGLIATILPEERP